MNGRGAVEIIVAEIALAQGLIGVDVFSILVFMALFTTATVPVLLTLGVRWLRRRGEMVKAGGRNEALIVGANAIARTIGQALEPSLPVTLIDTNRENLTEGSDAGLQTHSGSGLDELVLEEAGVKRASKLIAATPNAEVNVLAGQLATELGVPEVAVMLRDTDARTFRSLLSASGIAVIRAPEDLAGWEHATSKGRVEMTTIPITNGVTTGDHEDAPWPADEALFPVAVVNAYERSPYTSGVSLFPGDEVVCLARPGKPAFPEYHSAEVTALFG